MDDLVVRRFDDSDTDAVWRVHDRALRASELDYDPEYNRYLRHVQREFFEPGGWFTVVAADDHEATTTRDHDDDPAVVAIGGFQPLGYVREESSEAPSWLPATVAGTCRVRSVAVAPDRQGEGVGSALLDRLEARAGEGGFDYAVLQTHTSLAGACRFYERRGYTSRADAAAERWYGKELD